MRRVMRILVLTAAGALVALAVAGCGLKGITRPVEPPDTRIFVQGPVDTVNHVVHLYWFGSAPGGYIIGYEVRLFDTAAPGDTIWRFTTRTDSVITVLTPTHSDSLHGLDSLLASPGFSRDTFEVRAIDNRGVRDPHPARQAFDFRNQPPLVRLVGEPNRADRSDTTFASVTVDWTVDDPDGDASKVVCRIWLDGRADSPDIAPGTRFTVPSDRFLVGGDYASGARTLFIQGIDDGGMAGPIDSVSWYVRRPVTGARARLLLVDDLLSTNPAKLRVDTLYSHAIANAGAMGGVEPGTWTVLHLQYSQPFRSAKDMEQTLKQFEAVVWYRGEEKAFSTVLAGYGDGIGPYLDGGGRMFIESLNLTSAMSTDGAFPPAFVSRYLNSDGVFQYPRAPDSSAAWGLAGNVVLRCPSLADSLVNTRILVGLRAFRLRDASQALVVARAHTLTQDNPFDMAVALDVPQARGGRFIVDTYPVVSATAGVPQRASIVLLKIFELLGLTSP